MKIMDKILDKIENQRLENKRKNEKLYRNQYADIRDVIGAVTFLSKCGFKK